MKSKIMFPIFFITFVLLPIEAEINVTQVWNPLAIPLGRYYLLTRCLFKEQGGYSCIGCSTALHCYPANGAVQVECRGLFRYCRNGFCSLSQGEKCSTSNKITELPTTHVNSDSGITSEKPLMNEDNQVSTPVSSHISIAAIDKNLESAIKKNSYRIKKTESTLRAESVPLTGDS